MLWYAVVDICGQHNTMLFCISCVFRTALSCPSAALKKTVRRGEILVNGSTAKIDHTVQLGDKVQVITRVGCTNKTAAQFHKQQQQGTLPGLDVAWDDDHMAVVIKPQVSITAAAAAGGTAARASGCTKFTIQGVWMCLVQALYEVASRYVQLQGQQAKKSCWSSTCCCCCCCRLCCLRGPRGLPVLLGVSSTA